MKKKIRISCILIVLALVLPTLIGAALPVRDIEPNWYRYDDRQKLGGSEGVIPISTAPTTTGFHSMSMFTNIDYKQDLDKFQRVVTQYPVRGYLEWFHSLSEFVPVHYDTTKTGHIKPDVMKSGVNAYDYDLSLPKSQFDITLGQWMIQNNILTRPNSELKIVGNNMQVSPLSPEPFGVQNSLDLVERDEFVVTLAKAAFGPIESRPVLFEVEAWRYAVAVLYWEVWNRYMRPNYDDFGNIISYTIMWTFSHWELKEELDPTMSLPYARDIVTNPPVGANGQTGVNKTLPGAPGHKFMELTVVNNNPSKPELNRYNNFTHQRVSGLDPQIWRSPLGPATHNGKPITNPQVNESMWSYPGAAETYIRRVDFRTEFISNPEGQTYPTMHTYDRDYWTYVSANVWELYIHQLISKGVLDQNEIFKDNPNVPEGHPEPLTATNLETDDFRFTADFAAKFESTIKDWGKAQNQILGFPVMAPELGLVLPGNSGNSTSINIDAFGTSGRTSIPKFEDVLGQNYKVTTSGVTWDVSGPQYRVDMGLPGENLFLNQNMTVISALKLIERVMRVQEQNMSELEANIISHRYGARFLDNIAPEDKATVEYLIAMGIINFENFNEYSNIYNMLTREFAFVLLGRLANPASRSQFSQILMTDAAGFSTLGERNYQTYVNSNTPNIHRFINSEGNINHNPTIAPKTWYQAGGYQHLLIDSQGEFSVVSDLNIVEVRRPKGTSSEVYENADGSWRVIFEMDDPLKY